MRMVFKILCMINVSYYDKKLDGYLMITNIDNLYLLYVINKKNELC